MRRRLLAFAFSAATVACTAFGANPSGKSSTEDPPTPPPPPGSSSGGQDDSGGPVDDSGGGGGTGEGGISGEGGGSCVAPTGYCVVGYSTCCNGGTCAKSSAASQAHCCFGDGLPCTIAAECCIAKTALSASCVSGQCVQVQ